MGSQNLEKKGIQYIYIIKYYIIIFSYTLNNSVNIPTLLYFITIT